ncbi:hypothetical protein [Bradyrhizobium elkanii]|uniref:Uncharacterized protein n=1 Tax=Bradyrhizobium elkanii TaxID=29448 RepID=A0A8I1Y932_BRAEL|nr:hypothetical protein [Bradyrhizobium elkanii]MBP1294254.1 hypothetical protein [Bradyrhizobium elkanii]
MMRASNRKFLLLAGAAAVTTAVGFFIAGGRDSQKAHADRDLTTETAAAAAGAQVIPTEPKLRIEPK